MDPFTLIIGAASLFGTGMQLFGAKKQADTQSQAAQQSAQIAGQVSEQEIAANAQRKTAMELNARRQELEVFRNSQRARSMALTSATSQGAQFGSGLQGGYGQISGQTGVNASGIEQNLAIGQNLFGIDDRISQLRSQSASMQANYQSQSATYQGISNLGGAVAKSATPFANMFGGGLQSSGGYYGGSPSSNSNLMPY